jgi:predicted transglutaminase-like cysteine proteinase
MAKRIASGLVITIVACLWIEYAYSRELAATLPLPTVFASVETAPDGPLPAWVDYCRRHADDCRVDLHQPLSVPLTPALLEKLRSVNTAVNAAVRPKTDLKHWNVQDHWDLAEDGFGDCEDYQLLKRKLLVEAGIPRRALLMTVAWDAGHKGHALLMVRTDHGDFILDNERNKVLLWKDTGYVFVKRESQYATGWVAIDTSPSAAVSTTAQ